MFMVMGFGGSDSDCITLNDSFLNTLLPLQWKLDSGSWVGD